MQTVEAGDGVIEIRPRAVDGRAGLRGQGGAELVGQAIADLPVLIGGHLDLGGDIVKRCRGRLPGLTGIGQDLVHLILDGAKPLAGRTERATNRAGAARDAPAEAVEVGGVDRVQRIAHRARDAVRVVHQGHGRVREPGDGIGGARRGVQVVAAAAQTGLQGIEGGVRVVIVQRAVHRVHHAEGHLGEGMGERFVDLFVHTLAAGRDQHGRQRGLLLVDVDGDLARVRIAGVEGEHVLAQRFGQDDGGVVLAGLRALDGLVLVGDHPVHVVVAR